LDNELGQRNTVFFATPTPRAAVFLSRVLAEQYAVDPFTEQIDHNVDHKKRW